MNAFMPVAALVRKECIILLRRRRSVLALAFAYLAAWALQYASLSSYSFENINTLTHWSRESFTQSMLFLFLASGLVLPAIAGNAVVSELENETAEGLALTYLTPAGFLLGKLIGSVIYFLLLFLGILPLLSVPIFLVGLDLSSVLHAFALFMTGALRITCAGLLASTCCRSRIAAVGFSYLAMLFINGILYELAASTLDVTGNRLMIAPLRYLTLYTSPIMALINLVANPFTGNSSLALPFGLSPAATCYGYQILLAVFCFWLAVRFMHERWNNPYHFAKSTGARPQSTYARFRKFPVFQFELHRLFSERWSVGRVATGMTALLATMAAGLLVLSRWPLNPRGMIVSADHEAAQAASMFFIVTIAAFLPIPLASTMTRERERDTLDSLRMSQLCAREIVLEKLGAAFCLALFMSGVFSAVWIAMPTLAKLLNTDPTLAFSRGAITHAEEASLILLAAIPATIVAALLSATTTVVVSCWFRSSTAALIASMLAIAFLLAGVYYGAIVVNDSIATLNHTHTYSIRVRGGENWQAALSPLSAFGNYADSIRYGRLQANILFSGLVLSLGLTIILAAIAPTIYHRRHLRD